MSSTNLELVEHVTVPHAVVRMTLVTLQEFGGRGVEGLVLWLGDIEAHAANVQQAFAPSQHGIAGEDGLAYFVSGETLFELNRDLAASGLRLIAQVHSHPQEAYHSEADDRYAIVTAEGGLSLVVPDFGHAEAHPATWAVYRLNGGSWRHVPERDARALLEVVADQ